MLFQNQSNNYCLPPSYPLRLKKWINNPRWDYLSANPHAIQLLKENPQNINWSWLSKNPNAIELIEDNLDKIEWSLLCANPGAIYILQKHPEKINWYFLSLNTAPGAIQLIEANIDRIDWSNLSTNSSAIHLLEANPEKIDISRLFSNSGAIHLIQKYFDKINCGMLKNLKWFYLSTNSSAIHIIEKEIKENRSKMNSKIWMGILNNVKAVPIIEANPEHIYWEVLCGNPSAIHLIESAPVEQIFNTRSIYVNPAIFEYDYPAMTRQMNIIREELFEKALHPDRVSKWFEFSGWDNF